MAGIGDYIHYYWSNYQRFGIDTSSKGGQGNNESSKAMAIMQAQKQQMLNKVKGKQANYNQLQQTLQTLFYPSTAEENVESEEMRNRVSGILGTEAVKWITNWENGGTTYSKTKLGEVKGFYLSSLDKISKQINNSIQNIVNMRSAKEADQAIKQLEIILKQIEPLQTQAKAILGNADNGFISFKQHTQAQDLVKQINKSLDMLTATSRLAAIGNIAEVGIGSIDQRLNQAVDNTAKEIIYKDLFTGIRKEHVQLTQIGELADFSDIPKFKKTQKLEDGSVISMSADIMPTTYKMDLDLIYDNERYRVSAKNYNLAKYDTVHLLNKSPLLNILQKNADSNFINHYLNIVLTHTAGHRKGNVLNQAHETAKTMIILEGLMGLSQKKGYVDTLIINNRSARKIIVLPINKLAQQINNYNLFNITNYNLENNPEIYNAWVGNRDYRNFPSARKRLGAMLSKLWKDKISLSLQTSKLN